MQKLHHATSKLPPYAQSVERNSACCRTILTASSCKSGGGDGFGYELPDRGHFIRGGVEGEGLREFGDHLPRSLLDATLASLSPIFGWHAAKCHREEIPVIIVTRFREHRKAKQPHPQCENSRFHRE